MDDFDRALGERLRAARRRKGWSLHEVERSSNNEFKSSVLGAYERGERSISVQRLHRLARIYAIDVAHLIPSADEVDSKETVIDLDAMGTADPSVSEAIDRFLSTIQLRRRSADGSKNLTQLILPSGMSMVRRGSYGGTVRK